MPLRIEQSPVTLWIRPRTFALASRHFVRAPVIWLLCSDLEGTRRIYLSKEMITSLHV